MHVCAKRTELTRLAKQSQEVIAEGQGVHMHEEMAASCLHYSLCHNLSASHNTIV